MSLPKIRVVDEDTGEAVEISLFHGGSEPVKSLLEGAGERFARHFGKDDLIVQSAMVGNCLVKPDDHLWSKPVEFFKLDGLAWVVKLSEDPRMITLGCDFSFHPFRRIVLKVRPEDKVLKIKKKIQRIYPICHPIYDRACGLFYDPIYTQMRLICQGSELINERRLLDCMIPDQAEMYVHIHVMLKLPGGGNDVKCVLGVSGFEFADVSKKTSLQILQMSDKAPEWRAVLPGLCIEGPCNNQRCAAYKKSFVICNLEFQEDGIEICEITRKCQCPLCNSCFDPVTMGFYMCKFRWVGEKLETNPFAIRHVQSDEGCEWMLASREYHRYNDKTSGTQSGGTAKWRSLKVWTKSCFDNSYPCISCQEEDDDEDLIKLPCRLGHRIHSECYEKKKKRTHIICSQCNYSKLYNSLINSILGYCSGQACNFGSENWTAPGNFPRQSSCL